MATIDASKFRESDSKFRDALLESFRKDPRQVVDAVVGWRECARKIIDGARIDIRGLKTFWLLTECLALWCDGGGISIDTTALFEMRTLLLKLQGETDLETMEVRQPPSGEIITAAYDKALIVTRRIRNVATAKGAGDTIPADERTSPMTYRRAASLMGKPDCQDAAEWLSARVKCGDIVCEHIGRQAHVFSKNNFPQAVWDRILPKSRVNST